jgi:hypothetical protein
MAASSNPFFGLPLATLQTLQTAYVAAVTALASNQSYSLNGRTLQRADLDKVMTALGQINGAIAMPKAPRPIERSSALPDYEPIA